MHTRTHARMHTHTHTHTHTQHTYTHKHTHTHNTHTHTQTQTHTHTSYTHTHTTLSQLMKVIPNAPWCGIVSSAIIPRVDWTVFAYMPCVVTVILVTYM